MIDAIDRRDLDAADSLAAAHADQIVRQIRSYISAETRISNGIRL
jgi:DNA-binding GntR family transcriptional regulator